MYCIYYILFAHRFASDLILHFRLVDINFWTFSITRTFLSKWVKEGLGGRGVFRVIARQLAVRRLSPSRTDLVSAGNIYSALYITDPIAADDCNKLAVISPFESDTILLYHRRTASFTTTYLPVNMVKRTRRY